jgi:hypothetical protein
VHTLARKGSRSVSAGELYEGDSKYTVLQVVSWWGTAAWGLSSGVTKTSIVWQYRRVFPIKWVKTTCNVLLGLLTLYTLYSFFGAIFICVPVRAAWGLLPRSCSNYSIYYLLTSVSNIALDIVIYILPVKPILDLAVSRNQKIVLLGVFTFGAL